ncbi:MAG: methyltransferase [Pseudomonadota bacterium]
MTSPSPPERFDEASLTDDAFLGGRLSVWQPRDGYRAGVDPVFLAAAVVARPGETVLELGCGVGVASLCLMARVPGLSVTGVELQPAYAALAARNAQRNGMAMQVVAGDITRMPPEVRDQSFDHVITNPPYFLRRDGTPASDRGREQALGEETHLSAWIDAALRRLAPGGCLTVIQRADRLADLLGDLSPRAGAIEIRPLAPRLSRDATRVIVIAKKGAKTPLRLAPPTILHEGAAHTEDRDSYTSAAAAVLRDGHAWPWVGD